MGGLREALQSLVENGCPGLSASRISRLKAVWKGRLAPCCSFAQTLAQDLRDLVVAHKVHHQWLGAIGLGLLPGGKHAGVGSEDVDVAAAAGAMGADEERQIA